MSFLETVTTLGYDALVPVSKIEVIWTTHGQGGWEIHIKGQGNFEWVECFGGDDEKLNTRWLQIKELLGVVGE